MTSPTIPVPAETVLASHTFADGCCSASSPCEHQKRDPSTICDVCTTANALAASPALASPVPSDAGRNWLTLTDADMPDLPFAATSSEGGQPLFVGLQMRWYARHCLKKFAHSASPVTSDAEVTRLEWEHHPQADGQARAKTAFGTYRICFFGDYALWGFLSGEGLGGSGVMNQRCETMDAAKAAAQADFESRIRSCLVPSGGKDQEAVAVPYDDFFAAYRFVPRSKMFPDACLKTRLRSLLRSEDLLHADETEEIETQDLGKANLALTKAEATVAKLKGEIALLEETVETSGKALEPFAKSHHANPKLNLGSFDIEDDDPVVIRTWSDDGQTMQCEVEVTAGDFRRARAALASLTQHKAPALPASDAEGGANG